MSGRRKSGGGGPGRKNNNGKKGKKGQAPSSAGRGRGGNNNQRPRRSSLPNERTRNLDGASPTARSFMREDNYFRMKFLEEQELLANMMRVNQRKRQKESPARRPFSQRPHSESDSDSDSGSIDSDVVADYAMNISSDEDLGSLHESMKGLTADENFNVLRQYDEAIIADEEDTDDSDAEKQIKNTVSKFNLSRKIRKRREKKVKKRQNLVNAVVNKQNNRFIQPADFEDERPSLDAYLGTDREYYKEEDYYQVPEAALSNADKLRNKYLKMMSNTSFVRAKDPASFLEPAKDPSITTVTMTTTTTSTMTPVNTDTIIQKVETISISKNNNEEVQTETVTVVEEKKEKPDVSTAEFKDKTPALKEKLPEYRYEQVTEIKIVTSTTPATSNSNTPKQPAKNTKDQNKKANKKPKPVEDEIQFEWVGEESESDDDDEDDIVIDEDIEEDDEEDDEDDDLSDIDVADLIDEDDEDEEDDEEESESEEDAPVQYVFDRNSGLSKKEQSLMLYWAQEDELKRQARRRNRRPAGSESEDSELSEEEFLDMEDIDDEESSEEDEQFERILNSNYSPKDQRQFTTPSPKGKRMPRDAIGFPDEQKSSPSNRSQETPMSAKQRKLARNNTPGVKVSKKKIKKLNKLYKKGNKKRRLTRNDIEYWSQIMVEFVKDETMETKSVSNMNKFQLLQLAKLAKFYNLKASMAGSGKRRYAVVHKTEHSRLRNEEDLKKFLNRFFPEEEEITRRNGESRYGRSGHLGPRTKVNTRKDMQTRVLVGNTMPIPESNLGHIMLMRMGWIGGGLGSQKQGIEEPIQPVIRPRGRGLGFNANSL